MYPKKVHHVYCKVRNSNQYDDNKMLSGNSVLYANNQTPCVLVGFVLFILSSYTSSCYFSRVVMSDAISK
jgi:hypothetical protein